MIVNAKEAAVLLGISKSGMTQLLNKGRIIGAQKFGVNSHCVWQIPVGPDGLPVVSPTKLGRPPSIRKGGM